jgi:signal transduction histidine kinase
VKIRPTIRLRLTLLFGVLFLITSGVLISISYYFVATQGQDRDDFERGGELIREVLIEAGVPESLIPELPERSERFELPAGFQDALDKIRDDARQELLNDLLRQSLIALAITASGSLALAWFVAGRALRPVHEITEAATHLSEKNLHERLPNVGPDDELRRLRSAFNEMLERLEEGFAQRRRFAADASHELRTPLTVLRARADNALVASDATASSRSLATDVREQVDRADHLIEALFALARSEEGTASHTAVDLAELVGEVAGELTSEASRRGLEFSLELDDAEVMGDVVLLRLLVRNVVQNAIVHNIEHGSLDVQVYQRNDETVLHVANTGAVLDDEDIGRLFDRFRQGRNADERHGHGLGLPIVDAVARSHGARIVARPNDGGGLDLTVMFSRQ